MMKNHMPVAYLAAALFFLLLSSTAIADTKADFRCVDGKSFRITFSGSKNNYQDAWLVFSGKTRTILMKNRGAGSGSAYAGDGWAFEEHHGDVSLVDTGAAKFDAIPCHALAAK